MTRLLSVTLIIVLPAAALFCGFSMGDGKKLPDINPSLYPAPPQKQVQETGNKKAAKETVEFSGAIPLNIE